MKLSEIAVRLAVTPIGAAFDRWSVRFLGESPVSWVFARSEGVEYNPPILLTTRGRRSGQDRTVVLPHFAAGHVVPGAIAIVGSRGGMPTDPYWARNLKAHRDARIWYERREVPVTGEVAEGDQRAALWKTITERSPVYLVYQERAQGHREIPVFILRSKDGRALDAPG